MSNTIRLGRNEYGPVYYARQHQSGETHNGFTKGDRVRIKDDVDEVFQFAKGELGTVICTFPSICPGHVSVFVSLDRDKGKWPEADEGEDFIDDAVEKL